MAREEIDLRPSHHNGCHRTTRQTGILSPGLVNERTVTLIVEIQVQSLAVGVEQFLAEIREKFSELRDAPGDYIEDKMHIHPPVDPLFRVGEIGLGYDAESDLVVLVVREILEEGQESEEADTVRFWCTRTGVLSALWGLRLCHGVVRAAAAASRWIQKGIFARKRTAQT
jgi:hypothetical protein